MQSGYNTDEDVRCLIDSRAREFIQNIDDSSYDTVLLGLDYDNYGQKGSADITVVDTNQEKVEYFNFYLDSIPRGWDLDVPLSSEREQSLDQLLQQNGWIYRGHPRRKSRQDVGYAIPIEGNIYQGSDASEDTLEQLLDDLNSSRDIEDFEEIAATSI